MIIDRLYRMAFPAFVRMDAERVHRLALGFLEVLATVAPAKPPRRQVALEQPLWGTLFPNPIGLAAGFDKDGEALGAWPRLGFGFAEVGTVTPEPQAGNPRPRLFRHLAEESLQNAMGFNNEGHQALRHRLGSARRFAIPVGVNLGKNKTTPAERAQDDYLLQIDALSGLADYFVVNLSSPNTPGLRDLQNREFVEGLLGQAVGLTERPILVKLAPDLTDAAALDLALHAVEAGARGIVISNTTTNYALLPGSGPPGGLSGRVLTRRSREMLRSLAPHLLGRALLVSVGGIHDGDEAYRRILLGASLVQAYTGFVYAGPGFARGLQHRLLERLEQDGFGNVREAVGAGLEGRIRAGADEGRVP